MMRPSSAVSVAGSADIVITERIIVIPGTCLTVIVQGWSHHGGGSEVSELTHKFELSLCDLILILQSGTVLRHDSETCM